MRSAWKSGTGAFSRQDQGTECKGRAARIAFDGRLGDPQLESQQKQMLQKCAGYVERVLERKSYCKDELRKLLRQLVPQIQINLRAAAKLRIDNYHHQMLVWRKTLDADQWSQLRIVIPGAALPRQNSLAVQYFAKLLGERGEGRRIVYAESLFTESQALKLLGTHLLDTEIGVDFFSDPWRMHRDALGTAAAEYLEQLEFPGETP